MSRLRLGIARGTAKVHVSNILGKLAISTRSELAAEAARREIAQAADLVGKD